jgi:hypothetical protein
MALPARFDRLLTTHGQTATLYDQDAASNPRTTPCAVVDSGAVRMLGTSRGELVRAHFPSTTVVLPGQVLFCAVLSPQWYLIAKLLITTGFSFNPGVMAEMFALPLALSAERPVRPAPSALGGYDEPAATGGTPTGAVPQLTVSARTVRAGFTNVYDPLNPTALGPLPAGTLTAYCPLGSDVLADDTVRTLGEDWVVGQTNRLFANGSAFALQLILNETAGPGWAAP